MYVLVCVSINRWRRKTPTPSNSVPKKEKKEVQKSSDDKMANAKQDELSAWSNHLKIWMRTMILF